MQLHKLPAHSSPWWCTRRAAARRNRPPIGDPLRVLASARGASSTPLSPWKPSHSSQLATGSAVARRAHEVARAPPGERRILSAAPSCPALAKIAASPAPTRAKPPVDGRASAKAKKSSDPSLLLAGRLRGGRSGGLTRLRRPCPRALAVEWDPPVVAERSSGHRRRQPRSAHPSSDPHVSRRWQVPA